MVAHMRFTPSVCGQTCSTSERSPTRSACGVASGTSLTRLALMLRVSRLHSLWLRCCCGRGRGRGRGPEFGRDGQALQAGGELAQGAGGKSVVDPAATTFRGDQPGLDQLLHVM